MRLSIAMKRAFCTLETDDELNEFLPNILNYDINDADIMKILDQGLFTSTFCMHTFNTG